MNRKRASLAAAGTAALLVAGVAMFGVATANAAGAVTATFSTSSWGTGQTGMYTITNGTSSPITSWTVTFDLPSGTTLEGNNYWNASITTAGNHVTARNVDYNGNLAAGATTSFGFTTSGSGAPVNCLINGASCAGGAPAPSPTKPSP